MNERVGQDNERTRTKESENRGENKDKVFDEILGVPCTTREVQSVFCDAMT